MKTVWLVAIQHYSGAGWPQVLSAHADEKSAAEAASRDGYKRVSPGSSMFMHDHDHHPTRIVICMEVQP